MSYEFGVSARGFIVRSLQQAMRVTADGVYGRGTAAAVASVQRAAGLEISGRAGAPEFEAAGLTWPSEFERCMNFVSNLEGTSFGDCNPTDIDGAGLTMGIAGFTTAHGEVQELLQQYLRLKGNAAQESECYRDFQLMLGKQAGATAWKEFFFGEDGKVTAEWRNLLARAGNDPVMQQLQLAMAQARFWMPAVAVSGSLGFKSLRAKCFFLDVAVQNGGWRKIHSVYANRLIAWHSHAEPDRLVAAAHAVAASAKPRWQADVRARKLAIAEGGGVVHGRTWRLSSHAITIA